VPNVVNPPHPCPLSLLKERGRNPDILSGGRGEVALGIAVKSPQ